jgi:hypothetical protein
MTPSRVMENARIARDLGIGAIILDDGWFGPGLDTDDRPLNIGDYFPDPAKIPDLPALVRDIQGLGLKVLLWYAPTCLAPGSRRFAEWGGHVVHAGGKPALAPNGFYNLCPCHPAVRAYVCDETRRMLTEYGVDGFKVDLYNTLPATPCDNPHEHDGASLIAGVRAMMRDIWETAIAIRPDCLVELKQNYGNVVSAQYGTMVRAGDTAYDMDTNLERCAYVQSYAPVVHNDYLACSVEDAPRDIAIMMIKMIAGGVPTFSLDLPRQPAANRRVMRAWLGFYAQHLRLWAAPREPQNGRMDVWRMGGGRLTVLAAVKGAVEVELPRGDSWWLLNGTGRDAFVARTRRPLRAQVSTWDCALRERGRRRMTLRDGCRIEVPAGGAVFAEAV